MTGYGRATAALEGFSITVQVSSVNRKTLDLTIGLPEEWESLEPALGALVRKYASRGKVHVDIEVTGAASQLEASWDEQAASEAIERLRKFAASQGIEFRPTAELLWEIASSQRRGNDFPSVDTAEPVVTETLTSALREFAAMRAREGEALLVDFIKRAELLHRHVEAIAHRPPAFAATGRASLPSGRRGPQGVARRSASLAGKADDLDTNGQPVSA